MLEILKNSKGEILKLFFQDPEKEYYLREIARILGKEPGFFQEAINKLVNEGILKDERRADLRYFKLNKNYPIYEEIKKIISKTVGIEARIREIIDNLKGAECAFIFGSIAKNQESSNSDIDLMIIGGIDQDQLIKEINQAEDELKREINYHLYSREEVIKQLRINNDFLVKVFNEPKISLKGDPHEFTRINQSREIKNH